tara:strand:- start:3614 stop:4786 length:1173 start_codon:yes stop_codon:yes gene_type:complete
MKYYQKKYIKYKTKYQNLKTSCKVTNEKFDNKNIVQCTNNTFLCDKKDCVVFDYNIKRIQKLNQKIEKLNQQIQKQNKNITDEEQDNKKLNLKIKKLEDELNSSNNKLDLNINKVNELTKKNHTLTDEYYLYCKENITNAQLDCNKVNCKLQDDDDDNDYLCDNIKNNQDNSTNHDINYDEFYMKCKNNDCDYIDLVVSDAKLKLTLKDKENIFYFNNQYLIHLIDTIIINLIRFDLNGQFNNLEKKKFLKELVLYTRNYLFNLINEYKLFTNNNFASNKVNDPRDNILYIKKKINPQITLKLPKFLTKLYRNINLNDLTQKQIDIVPQLYEINQNKQSLKPIKKLNPQQIYDFEKEQELQDLDQKTNEETDDKSINVSDFSKWLGFIQN